MQPGGRKEEEGGGTGVREERKAGEETEADVVLTDITFQLGPFTSLT